MGTRVIRRMSLSYPSGDVPFKPQYPLIRSDCSSITDRTEWYTVNTWQVLVEELTRITPQLEQDVQITIRMHQERLREGVYRILGELVIEEPGNETSTDTTS